MSLFRRVALARVLILFQVSGSIQGYILLTIFPFICKMHLKNKTRHILLGAPFIGQILYHLTSVIFNLFVGEDLVRDLKNLNIQKSSGT